MEVYPIFNYTHTYIYIYIYVYGLFLSDKREGDKGHVMLRDISPWTQVFIYRRIFNVNTRGIIAISRKSVSSFPSFFFSFLSGFSSGF